MKNGAILDTYPLLRESKGAVFHSFHTYDMLASCQFDLSGQFDPYGESEFKLETSFGTSKNSGAS